MGVCGWRRRPKYLIVGAAVGETVFVVKQQDYQPLPGVLPFPTRAAVCNNDSQLLLPLVFQSETRTPVVVRASATPVCLFVAPPYWPVGRPVTFCGRLARRFCRVFVGFVRSETLA